MAPRWQDASHRTAENDTMTSDAAINCRCSSCGAAFYCGAVDRAAGAASASPCWCTQQPLLPSGARISGASCLCPECLMARIDSAQQAPDSGSP
jgi:hypothetical protein